MKMTDKGVILSIKAEEDFEVILSASLPFREKCKIIQIKFDIISQYLGVFNMSWDIPLNSKNKRSQKIREIRRVLSGLNYEVYLNIRFNFSEHLGKLSRRGKFEESIDILSEILLRSRKDTKLQAEGETQTERQ